MYEFKIDLDGDAVEDLTYRITFDERDFDGQAALRRCAGSPGREAVDPNAAGTVLAQGVTGETVTTANGLRIWAGKAGDPFWIEPDVLHAVGHAFQDGTTINLTGWDPSKAKNLFAGQTAYSIVLEVPDAELLASTSAKKRIGVWAVATLATDAGGWRSINRVGLPMIHPLFTQFNEDLGNRLNAGRPADDFATYGDMVAQGDRRRCRGQWDLRGSCWVWREGGPSLFPQHPPLRGRHPGHVWLRGVERPLSDGQCAGRDVQHRGKYSCPARHRQGIGHREAL